MKDKTIQFAFKKSGTKHNLAFLATLASARSSQILWFFYYKVVFKSSTFLSVYDK